MIPENQEKRHNMERLLKREVDPHHYQQKQEFQQEIKDLGEDVHIHYAEKLRKEIQEQILKALKELAQSRRLFMKKLLE